MVEGKKRMTAKRKLEVYMEMYWKDANVGEILRRYGLHLNDLKRIEMLVEHAALTALNGSRRGPEADPQADREYAELVAELAQTENTLAVLTGGVRPAQKK
jgi:transposase-like protein